MYPDDYLGAYEIIEESNGKAKIKCKITPQRCRPCDHGAPQSNGPRTKTVYDIDQRTGNVIEIEVTHYQYRCSHPGCKSSFVFDMLPTKCFPTEQTEGRTSKSKSKDILNRAMDYLLFGADDDGQPVTVSDAAKKFGYDRKVISTELHARVNAAMSEHILSNETCAQAAMVPFTYRGERRCAIMGYVRDDSSSVLRPVLYDIRDKYERDDLLAYLKEYRSQGLVVPEITYTDMDDSFLDLIYKLYVEDYQNPHDEFFVGIIKSIVGDKIKASSTKNLTSEFELKWTYDFFRRRLEAHLLDKDIIDGPDDSEVFIDAEFAKQGMDFYDILDAWMEDIVPDAVAEELQPLYDTLYAFADSIDVSMTHYREDGVCPEGELGFVHYFHKCNLDFAEMRYRVHCLSKNKQNVPFKHLMNGQYQPPFSGKTLQRYYIDLRELNEMFQE